MKNTNRPYFRLIAVLIVWLLIMRFVPTRADLQRQHVTATATVVRLNSDDHHPQIAFTTASGKQYEVPVTTPLSVETGTDVPIRYDPADPGASVEIDRSAARTFPYPFFPMLPMYFQTTWLRAALLDR